MNSFEFSADGNLFDSLSLVIEELERGRITQDDAETLMLSILKKLPDDGQYNRKQVNRTLGLAISHVDNVVPLIAECAKPNSNWRPIEVEALLDAMANYPAINYYSDDVATITEVLLTANCELLQPLARRILFRTEKPCSRVREFIESSLRSGNPKRIYQGVDTAAAYCEFLEEATRQYPHESTLCCKRNRDFRKWVLEFLIEKAEELPLKPFVRIWRMLKINDSDDLPAVQRLMPRACRFMRCHNNEEHLLLNWLGDFVQNIEKNVKGVMPKALFVDQENDTYPIFLYALRSLLNEYRELVRKDSKDCHLCLQLPKILAVLLSRCPAHKDAKALIDELLQTNGISGKERVLLENTRQKMREALSDSN